MKKILIVVGTRPNFIKVTQFKKVATNNADLIIKIVHTGQHYDNKMADVFFKQFNLIPDYFLDIPQASANTQMAEIMLRLEKLINTEYYPDLMIVVGDVNSTLAAALTANKLGIKLAHIESGLRSFDRTMPEEINRILTDEICDYFFVTEQSGYDNLIKEGKNKDAIFFVGNTMIDTLVAYQGEIQTSKILAQLNLNKGCFALMTMHRPATVDSEKGLTQLMDLIELITQEYELKLVFPIHPRTLKNLEKFNLLARFQQNNNIIVTEPLDYFAFQKLILSCKFVVTDSGGIQEETTFQKIPCLTLRANTERPSTIEVGSNTLVPFDLKIIELSIQMIATNFYKKSQLPTMWDGMATHRILKIIDNL